MILIGQSVPSKYISYLRSLGQSLIILPPDPRLPEPVASHPDMLLFWDQDTLITDRTYYLEFARKELDEVCAFTGLHLQLTDEPPQLQYPQDIRFNALRVGSCLFCHPTHTSPAVTDSALRKNWNIIPTNQGYARCAACPIGSDALITADPAIASAAKKQNLDVCIIRQGHVLLPGYPHGFIGGCCGVYENTVLFCGDPHLHQDGERMLSFVRAHGLEPQWIPDLPLFDAGSIFFIPERNPR